jgi:hypothetical protein
MTQHMVYTLYGPVIKTCISSYLSRDRCQVLFVTTSDILQGHKESGYCSVRAGARAVLIHLYYEREFHEVREEGRDT